MKVDIAVVGAGPAGSTLSTLLAQAGYRVLLLERELEPPYKIGESLLPATVRSLADMLGIRTQLPQAGFVSKRGATFSWGARPEHLWHLNFGGPRSEEPVLSDDVPAAFNVVRSEFDRLLLDNAKAHGVEVKMGCRATDFIEQDGRVVGLMYKDSDGQTQSVESTFVADASGQKSKLARHIGKRALSKFFEKLAVWCYYDNGKRLPDPLSGNVLFQTTEDAWVWYIPLNETLTSVGVVAPVGDWQKGVDTGVYLQQKINACPLIKEYLGSAQRSQQPPYDQTRICSEYSYCASAFWRPGAFTVGDASCFVDVLLSSGVHLATYAAVTAAQSVQAVLGDSLSEEIAMNEYETRVRREFAIFFDGLVGLYDMTLNAEDYALWLRKLLIDTSGIALEAETLKRQPVVSADQSHLCRASRRNLHLIREYNQTQIEYSGDPRRRSDGLPRLRHTLVSSADLRQWQRVV